MLVHILQERLCCVAARPIRQPPQHKEVHLRLLELQHKNKLAVKRGGWLGPVLLLLLLLLLLLAATQTSARASAMLM
jgi:hypothetical protein